MSRRIQSKPDTLDDKHTKQKLEDSPQQTVDNTTPMVATQQILMLQRTIGNRATQKLLQRAKQNPQYKQASDNRKSRKTIQRGPLDFIFGKSEEEKLKELNGGLKDASSACDSALLTIQVIESAQAAGKNVNVDKARLTQWKESLEKGKKGFDSVSGKIGKGLEIKGKIDDTSDFLTAVKAVYNLEISDNPEAAAKAFDTLFSTTGKMTEHLPDALQTPYFEIFKNWGTFFQDMLHGLDPMKRKGAAYDQMRKAMSGDLRGDKHLKQ